MEVVGFKGEIWVLYKDYVEVEILDCSSQYIHIQFMNHHSISLNIKFVNACLRVGGQKELWNSLFALGNMVGTLPWCIAGDFNAKSSMEDRKRGVASGEYPCPNFENYFLNSNMVDVGYQGSKFTCYKGNLLQ